MKIQSKTKLNHKGEQSEVGYINLLQDGYLTIDNLECGDYVLTMYVQCDSIGNISIGEQSQDITTSWNKVSYILSNVENIINIKFKKGVYYIYEVKLEKGNKATDWTPAPEDTEESVNNVRTKAQGIIDNIYTPNTTTIDGGKITTGTITAAQIAAGTITSNEIAAGTITADKINLNDLFAQNITATGTITGAHLVGSSGEFSRFMAIEGDFDNGDYGQIGINEMGYTPAGGEREIIHGIYIEQQTPSGIHNSINLLGQGGIQINTAKNNTVVSGIDCNVDGTLKLSGKVSVSSVGTFSSPIIYENGTALSDKYAPISHSHDDKYIGNYGSNPNYGNGAGLTQPGGEAALSIRTTTGISNVGIFYLSQDNCYIANSSDDAYTFGVFDTDLTKNMADVDAASFVVLSNGGGAKIRGQEVIHRGNIGSQSVNYANTAGSAPASDVYSWAKQSTKPSYALNEITGSSDIFKVVTYSYNSVSVANGSSATVTPSSTNIPSGYTAVAVYTVNSGGGRIYPRAHSADGTIVLVNESSTATVTPSMKVLCVKSICVG